MLKGKVKWFDSNKGFGFITTDGGNEVFVHYTGIEDQRNRSLKEGQEVTFEITEGKKGPQATVVKVVNSK
jgi:CspA family cold shock protein